MIRYENNCLLQNMNIKNDKKYPHHVNNMCLKHAHRTMLYMVKIIIMLILKIFHGTVNVTGFHTKVEISETTIRN